MRELHRERKREREGLITGEVSGERERESEERDCFCGLEFENKINNYWDDVAGWFKCSGSTRAHKKTQIRDFEK